MKYRDIKEFFSNEENLPYHGKFNLGEGFDNSKNESKFYKEVPEMSPKQKSYYDRFYEKIT